MSKAAANSEQANNANADDGALKELEGQVKALTEELITMAKRPSEEIQNLRAQIGLLQPKAQAFDSISLILGLIPRQSRTMGPDLASLLERRAAELATASSEPVAAAV